MQRLVIVGASLAGLRAAQAARAGGFAGDVVLIGDEPHRPYTRPPLSKELLGGGQTAEQCALPHGTLEADWQLGVAASGLDREARKVLLGDGSSTPYERLIIATGCRARSWHGPGAELPGVHTLRGLDDSLALRTAFRDSERLVIVGAGFIGCEVAATARKQGVEVTLLDIAPHPLLPLGPEIGGRCARLHTDHGVDVRCGTSIAAILGEGRVRAVALQDGTELPADIVLLALGAQPNTEWLGDSGLELNAGVVCDTTLTTTRDPDILAAGDLTEWPHRLAGGAIVRVEHWTTAAEQGQLAGRNALLDPEQRSPHEAPPYFWSDQYDTKIQSAGFPALATHMEILDEEPDQGRLVATGTRDGQLVAAVTFNAAKRLMAYRRELATPGVGAAG
ncbi:MAG TPA: FAD-dependent oxidoreductase [Solirubrobacteraceae bacterium]|jgi:NADPH-dependent 2,4-dienoyl-CoA reductase/sulfur reductase-like enzyme|nr:FAD-dependent oxidoreductase [Solirubrobacteraceae bacterium]